VAWWSFVVSFRWSIKVGELNLIELARVLQRPPEFEAHFSAIIRSKRLNEACNLVRTASDLDVKVCAVTVPPGEGRSI
jgi:hypothetical protein